MRNDIKDCQRCLTKKMHKPAWINGSQIPSMMTTKTRGAFLFVNTWLNEWTFLVLDAIKFLKRVSLRMDKHQLWIRCLNLGVLLVRMGKVTTKFVTHLGTNQGGNKQPWTQSFDVNQVMTFDVWNSVSFISLLSQWRRKSNGFSNPTVDWQNYCRNHSTCTNNRSICLQLQNIDLEHGEWSNRVSVRFQYAQW